MNDNFRTLTAQPLGMEISIYFLHIFFTLTASLRAVSHCWRRHLVTTASTTTQTAGETDTAEGGESGDSLDQFFSKGRVQKFMLGKLVDFSIKWVGGVSLVH